MLVEYGLIRSYFRENTRKQPTKKAYIYMVIKNGTNGAKIYYYESYFNRKSNG